MRQIHFMRVLGMCIMLSFLSCSIFEDGERTTIRINHHKQAATGSFSSFFFLMQEGDEIGTTDWQIFYTDIKDFEYEWGFIYDLDIRKKTVDNPPADASSNEFFLEKIIDKQTLDRDTRFTLLLKSVERGIEGLVKSAPTPNKFMLIDETEIDCSNLCDTLANALIEKDQISGIFTHGASSQLTLHEIITE